MTAFPRYPAFSRRTRYAVLAGTACMGLTAALTGCSAEEDPDAGTNGVGKLSAAKIEKKTRTAAESAGAVHLSGNIVSGKQTYKLDMRLSQEGGSGKVTSRASTFELLRVGDDLYLKADAGFWKSRDSEASEKEAAEAAEKLDGKYVKVPADDPVYKELSGFTEMDTMLDGVLTLHGKLSKGERAEVGGVRTVRLAGGKGSGGTLDVSLEGEPYPLRFQRAGDAGVVKLADWNKDFELKAPGKDEIVDYGEQVSTTD